MEEKGYLLSLQTARRNGGKDTSM